MPKVELKPPYDEILRICLNYARSNSADIAETIEAPFAESDVEELAEVMGVEL